MKTRKTVKTGKMKTNLVSLAGFLVVFLCSGMTAAEEITVVGTGSGMALLQALGDAFMKDHAGITISVPDSIGSSGGIKAVGTDQYRIGRVGRPLKDTEAHFGLTYIPFARVPIVFFVNKNAGVTDMTPQQICSVYSGDVTNWKQAGGNDARIRVVRREDGDSSLQVLKKSFPGFNDIVITAKSKITLTDQETLEVVESVENTICFGTYGNARIYDLNILTISGKNPASDDYPYTGDLGLIVKEKNNTGNIKKFIEYVTSPAAQEVIRNAGGLPF